MTAIATSLAVDGIDLNQHERQLVHAALLAQVDDVHAGGVYQWTEEDHLAAGNVLNAITHTPQGGTPDNFGSSLTAKVITTSLIVPLYDLDHPAMTEEEWDEAERLLALLSQEFGR